MNCPQCGFSNRERARFCSECGFAFSLTCPDCGVANRSQAKFCDHCGAGLHPYPAPLRKAPAEPSTEEKLHRIQRYLPPDLIEKILAQKDRIEGERREVTIMFCDMKGFTPLTELLGPDKTFGLMDELFEILVQKVNNYQGTVNELRGDGILAFFGAPIALEDAPQRAVRSALAIHRAMVRFNERLKEKSEVPDVMLRIGINTGPVVVGAMGNDLRVQFTAVGETINMASRMESLAEPGTVCVTEETFRLTEGFFRFEALGQHRVKGKKEPVRVYRVISPSNRRTRFDVSAERGLAPFVGRARELEFLMALFERVKAGSGQALSIVSEAGMGKSRLLYEFRKAMIHQDVTFLEGKCLSYSRRVAYHPIIDIVRTAFRIQEEDEGGTEVQEKVRGGLEAIGADVDATLPFVLELLSSREIAADRALMSPESRKERVLAALRRIVLKGAERRPLILAVEDLHWIDQNSGDVFKDLMENISGTRVFLLFTCRPEYRFTGAGNPYHSQITLDRLSRSQSLQIVRHLVGTETFDVKLEDLICSKTDGIPLFIEEYVRLLQGLEIIEKRGDSYCLAKRIPDMAIPSTLQEIIMARVDALPEGAKEVIHAGAAIEREFSYVLIREVMGLEEKKLRAHLSALKGAGLVCERGIHPDSFFVFSHAVTQEVIYDSIIRRRKRRLHERIGNALESLYSDSLEAFSEKLALHYYQSNNPEKGAHYCLLAAKKSENKASFPDAIAYGEKRLECLENLARTEDVDRRLIDARTTLGLYYTQMNYHDAAKRVVAPALPLAESRGYKKRLAQIYTITGSYHFIVEEDYDLAFKQLQRAMAISNEIGEILSLFLANFWMGFALIFQCRFSEALEHWQQALEINASANSLWGVSVVKSAMVWALSKQGDIALSHRTSKEAIQMAEKSRDIFSKAYACGGHGISLFHKGCLEDAADNLREGARLCDRINYLSMGSLFHGYLGETLYHSGDWRGSIASFDRAAALAESSKFVPSLTNLYRLSILRAKAALKEPVEMAEVYDFAGRNRIRITDGPLASLVADILMHSAPDACEIEGWLTRAVGCDEANEMKWYLGTDHLKAGMYWRQNRDSGKALSHLEKAETIFSECGADGWVEKARRRMNAAR